MPLPASTLPPPPPSKKEAALLLSAGGFLYTKRNGKNKFVILRPKSPNILITKTLFFATLQNLVLFSRPTFATRDRRFQKHLSGLQHYIKVLMLF